MTLIFDLATQSQGLCLGFFLRRTGRIMSPITLMEAAALKEPIFADGILKGHVACVTGGGTGITGGVARALAEAGANVALVSRSIEHLEPAAKAINDARVRSPSVSEGNSQENPAAGEALAVAADVRKPDEVANAIAATVERFGKIDIVVNGAAGNFLAKDEDL